MFVERTDGRFVNLLEYERFFLEDILKDDNQTTIKAMGAADRIRTDGSPVGAILFVGTLQDCQEHLAGLRAAMLDGQGLYSFREG